MDKNLVFFDFRPSTFDPRPRLLTLDLDFRPSTYDPRPSTYDPRPSTYDPRPSTITQTLFHTVYSARSGVDVAPRIVICC